MTAQLLTERLISDAKLASEAQQYARSNEQIMRDLQTHTSLSIATGASGMSFSIDESFIATTCISFPHDLEIALDILGLEDIFPKETQGKKLYIYSTIIEENKEKIQAKIEDLIKGNRLFMSGQSITHLINLLTEKLDFIHNDAESMRRALNKLKIDNTNL